MTDRMRSGHKERCGGERLGASSTKWGKRGRVGRQGALYRTTASCGHEGLRSALDARINNDQRFSISN
jgi:hypothetical protein